MALSTMQRGNLDQTSPDTHGRISKQSVELEGVTVTRVTFGPGAKWSEDVRDSRRAPALPPTCPISTDTIDLVM
jgi:hypothetical protein